MRNVFVRGMTLDDKSSQTAFVIPLCSWEVSVPSVFVRGMCSWEVISNCSCHTSVFVGGVCSLCVRGRYVFLLCSWEVSHVLWDISRDDKSGLVVEREKCVPSVFVRGMCSFCVRGRYPMSCGISHGTTSHLQLLLSYLSRTHYFVILFLENVFYLALRARRCSALPQGKTFSKVSSLLNLL